jgi:pimeloyl-ACP methyl ester carboxylesterase
VSTKHTPIQDPTTNGEIVQPRVLQYDVQGEGEPLVLVPGGLTGWISWVPHADRLSATRTTVRVQPIHNELGSAGRPGEPGYTAETERESLRLTLDRLGIDVADFAGWSGGGRALLVRGDVTTETDKRVVDVLAEQLPNATVVELPGDHAAHIESIDAFLEALENHLATA